MTVRGGSTSSNLVAVHDEVMAMMLRLVGDYPQLPAGSVMRCVARAVRGARTAGLTLEQIPVRAEQQARRVLDGRMDPQVRDVAPGSVGPAAPDAAGRRRPRG